MGLTGVRHELEYIVVQDMAQLGHPITWVCQALSISRSAYYHWLHRTPSARERENRHILDEMRHLYQAYRGIYGYRRLADEYNAIHHTNYNEKRFHRLAKIGNLRAIIRTKQPAPHAAPLMQLPANILARDFVAQAPNEKWLTDVTELEYASGQKLYLSAILDLKANDIVAFNISPSNNNNLVFTTFDRAIEKYPDAPMEAFWGTLKSEMYHLDQFDDYDTLAQAICDYIHFYNTRRRQRRLDKLPPLAYRAQQALLSESGES